MGIRPNPDVDTRTKQVNELFEKGYSEKEIAKNLGVTINQVKYSRQRKRRSSLYGKVNSIKRTVQDNGVLTIEEGINGGLIVTLDEKWTGSEKDSLRSAIYSAYMVKEAEDD
jgi:predicted transcriptional regulator